MGAATISVSGGSVEYLYAGGGNAETGTTVTGSAAITISGSGAANFVFLGGRNATSSVTGTASLTLTGGTKTLTRISGHNGSGQALTGSSELNVQTDVTVGYLDNVSQINLLQDNLLNVTDLAVNTGKLNFQIDDLTGSCSRSPSRNFICLKSFVLKIMIFLGYSWNASVGNFRASFADTSYTEV